YHPTHTTLYVLYLSIHSHPLSLHDALPICRLSWRRSRAGCRRAPSFPEPSKSVTAPCRRADARPALPTPPSGNCGNHRQRVPDRSEEHTSELQSRENLVFRLLLG